MLKNKQVFGVLILFLALGLGASYIYAWSISNNNASSTQNQGIFTGNDGSVGINTTDTNTDSVLNVNGNIRGGRYLDSYATDASSFLKGLIVGSGNTGGLTVDGGSTLNGGDRAGGWSVNVRDRNGAENISKQNKDGSINVNDIYIRSIGKWASAIGDLSGLLKSIRLAGAIGTNGFDPDSGYPVGWGGGVHTWDVYAEGSVRADKALCIGGDCRASWADTGNGTENLRYCIQCCKEIISGACSSWGLEKCSTLGNWTEPSLTLTTGACSISQGCRMRISSE